jgi:hypothetical protein
MEFNEMKDWEYYTEEDKQNNEITLWRVMNIYSNDPMMAVAQKKDGMIPESRWEDYLCRILDDGTPNVRLKTIRRMIEKIESDRKKEEFATHNRKCKQFVVGKSPVPIMFNNHHKQILSDNNISMAPLVRSLIENYLKEQGLL